MTRMKTNRRSPNRKSFGAIGRSAEQLETRWLLTASVVVDEGDVATLSGSFTPGWTDLGADLGQVADEGNGAWTWQLQTVDDAPLATVTVTATYPDNSSETATFDLTINNVVPVASIYGMSANNEGQTYELTLEEALDPGADTVTDWIVNWGDGTTDTYSSPGVKTHVYADGVALSEIVVDLQDEDGLHPATASMNVMTFNVPPTVNPALTSISAAPGEVAHLTGTYNDAGLSDTVTIASSSGQVSFDQVGNWAWSYDVPLDAVGAQLVTLTATDNDGDITNTDVALLAATVTADQSNVTVDEGEFAVVTGTYTLIANDPVTMSSSVGSVVLTGPGTWAWFFETTDGPAEDQIVTITGTYDSGPVHSDDVTLTVNNLAPTITSEGTSLTAPEGQIATFSGTFDDFGDLVTLAASVGDVTSIGNTWYWTLDTVDDAAAQTVTITATDDEGASASVAFDFTVENVSPFLVPNIAEFAEVGVPST